MMNYDEIKELLAKIEDGDKILEYIEQLKEEIDELKHQHHVRDFIEDDIDEEDEDKLRIFKTSYESKFSVSEWENFLKNPEIFTEDDLKVMKRMHHVAAPTDSSELSIKFGLSPLFYSFRSDDVEERLLPYIKNKEDINSHEKWAILYNCWGRYSLYEKYTLIPELFEAIGNIDLSHIPLKEEK